MMQPSGASPVRFVRFAAMFAVFSMAVYCVGCQPVAGGASGNSGNAPSNSSDEKSNAPAPTGDASKPVEPKEAKYPHQVIAALARVYLQYGIIDEALRLYDLAIVQQLRQNNTEDAENWIGFADALVKA